MALGVFTSNMDLYGGNSVFGDYNFGLPEQILKTIDEHSWSSCFYKHITSNIDEKIFAPLYSSQENTRPSSPVRLVVAALVLKSKFGLKDDELLEHCISYAPFKNALGLGFFEDTPFSKNTFNRFRQRLEEHEKETGEDLMKQQMIELAYKHCETLDIDGKTVRIDSMMIDSRGKFMTRLEIIVATNTKCLKDIAGSAGVAAIPDSLAHYLEPDNTNKTVYHQEEAVVGSKVEKALADSIEIKKLMENAEYPCLKSLGSYGTLCRLLDDQMKEGGDGEAVSKGKNEIEPGSMQNPRLRRDIQVQGEERVPGLRRQFRSGVPRRQDDHSGDRVRHEQHQRQRDAHEVHGELDRDGKEAGEDDDGRQLHDAGDDRLRERARHRLPCDEPCRAEDKPDACQGCFQRGREGAAGMRE